MSDAIDQVMSLAENLTGNPRLAEQVCKAAAARIAEQYGLEPVGDAEGSTPVKPT